ncbi:hypothetical protein JCM19239_4731 [Vibrio variabilis]|uniref:Uncharacterized protein n=1 Tax=Vibrio variabilis TaxID=990271 RepID=A0ABQ0JQ94_9VIBR|nr:hypothetical protein JCM19239_4731 [Vibrio variabilis]
MLKVISDRPLVLFHRVNKTLVERSLSLSSPLLLIVSALSQIHLVQQLAQSLD